MANETEQKALFHLPGLFEFYELYRLFLPLFAKERDWFYPWAAIGSLYGAPEGCLWGGGRTGGGDVPAKEALALCREYGVSARLTFSNALLGPEHLGDRRCNALLDAFGAGGTDRVRNGVIVCSELLTAAIARTHPELYLVSSTTKVLTDFADFEKELARKEFAYVVPDFRLNKAFAKLTALPQAYRGKTEFLVNECCWPGCAERKRCYEAVSRKNLGLAGEEHLCKAPGGDRGYRFSAAMENPMFIGTADITDVYLPNGFSNFKIEGRGLGSAVVLECLLYYLTRPECRLKVREAVYLDSMLDLF